MRYPRPDRRAGRGSRSAGLKRRIFLERTLGVAVAAPVLRSVGALQAGEPERAAAGAVRNIAAFHRLVLAGDCSNGTVARSLDGALATILGREAGLRRARLTLEELVRENRRIEVDLRGLKE